MFKKLLSFLLALLGVSSLYAAGLPQVSTDGHEVWYLIQFSNGGSVIGAPSDAAEVTTPAINGSEAQFWKFVGDNQKGYTITNKLGYTLCSDNANKNTMLKAASAPTGTTLFLIKNTKYNNYKGDFELVPVENTSVSINLFGGHGANRGAGYWLNDKPDPNNCVKFVSEKEYQILGKYAIIPYPQQLDERKTGILPLNELVEVSCADSAMEMHLKEFIAQVKLVSGVNWALNLSEKDEAFGIRMLVDSKMPEEGYAISVLDDRIAVKASGATGFFYALQTLKQMLPNAFFAKERNDKLEWGFPYLDIVDEPNLKHRGFMLDVCRHFFDIDEVKRILDVMSLYKMNIFHWHLTEDQGWRIEIPEYPRLTEVGSIRKSSYSNPGEGGAFYDDTEYGRGMWYSQQQLKEVVAYAQERHINIIPEVDFPGHMVAAVTAYPELSCDPSKQYEVRVGPGISQDVLNIGNDQVIEFLKTIMDNLAEIFPYQYIHFGGDECPVDQWRNNSDCLKRVKDNGLKGVEELQSWLIEELGTYVKEKYNRDIMVWDELVKHWNTKNKIKPIVMCWHNNNDVAANVGLKSITCPHDYTYLDMMQIEENKALVDEPYRGGWNDGKVTTVQKTYSLDPNYKTAGREEFVLGVQANMWTETTNDNYELEYQLFPRLIATAEVGWLPVSLKNWNSFYKRLQSHDEILDAKQVNYAKHYIEPKEMDANEQVIADADHILSQSIRGGVGYAAAELYDALSSALQVAQQDTTAVEALQIAVKNYKEAPIVQPEPGKYYQIVSAATYYKKQFAGSSLYQKDNGLRIHYTPQTEPEELWEFVATEKGFFLQNVGSKQQVVLNTINKAVGLKEAGTAVRVDKATKATRNYKYIPGVVTISAVSGYSANVTGKVKRLVAQVSGDVNVADDAALCYPGTWKMVEVIDFKDQLQGLCEKCERVLRNNDSESVGNFTDEAISFLRNEVLSGAQADLEGLVSEDLYLKHLARYNEFLLMPRVTLLDHLVEGVYYYIQNVYFSDFYAAVNVNKLATRRLDSKDDQFKWSVEKNEDGTIYLKNKANGQYACGTSAEQQAPVVFAKEKTANAIWMPEWIKTDLNQAGVAITESTHTFSWYTWAQGTQVGGVDFRPKDWGASIWNFIKTNEVVTGIDAVNSDHEKITYYDLSGRKVQQPSRGLYIQSNGKKVYMK